LDCNHLKIFKSKTRNPIEFRVFFSPDGNGNPLLKKDSFFLIKKERPTEAPLFI